MRPLAEPRIRIAPSLLAADFSRLRDEIARVEAGGAELLHLDVMDGHFVPNISFGVPVVAAIRPVTGLFLDTHLMITDPRRYAEPFVKAGADSITFHVEASSNPRQVIDHLRRLDVVVGVSLNPHTPVRALDGLLDLVDLVNVMTVEPGFGGQSFRAEMLPKVRDLAARLRPDQRLEVDGGVDARTIADAAASGADTFVAGTSVFAARDPAETIGELRRAAESAREGRRA